MPIDLTIAINRLVILRDRLFRRIDQVRQIMGGNTGEVIEAADIWGAVKDITQELIFLNDAIDNATAAIADGTQPDYVIERLKARLVRDIETAARKLKSALRLEKKANDYLNSPLPTKKAEKKKEAEEEEKEKEAKAKQEKEAEEEKKKIKAEAEKKKKEEVPKKEPVKQKPEPEEDFKRTGKPNDVLKAMSRAISRFNKSIPASQRAMYEAIIDEVNRLELYSDGKIRPTVKNLSILASIKSKINRIVLTDEYKQEVREFAKSFNEVTKLQNEYWKSLESTFSPRPLLKEIRKQAITDVVAKLTEAGIGANVSDRIIDILKTNITTGGSYKSLTAQLRDGLLNTEQKGYLDKYAKQVTVDSLNQYNAQYSQIVSSDLGYTWFKYDNTDIDTTRPFCDSMTDQPYFHISQVPSLLRAEGLYYSKDGVTTKVPIYPPTGLPHGMIPGTNADNFFIRRGGYNCGHQIRPVAERQVPAEVRDKVLATIDYKKFVT